MCHAWQVTIAHRVPVVISIAIDQLRPLRHAHLHNRGRVGHLTDHDALSKRGLGMRGLAGAKKNKQRQ